MNTPVAHFAPSSPTLFALCLVGLFPGLSLADIVTVQGTANIFGAGHASPPENPAGNTGTLPPMISFSYASYFTFEVSGLVGYNAPEGVSGPDGRLVRAMSLDSIGGISGIQHDKKWLFLVGVFLSDSEPSGTAPPIVNYTNDNFTTLSPMLNQTFFIGDGLTGTGTGIRQKFYAPSGATRLFLGLPDGFNFTGTPGYYDDNVGSLLVTTTLAVPEPTSLLLIGGLVFALSPIGIRRRQQFAIF